MTRPIPLSQATLDMLGDWVERETRFPDSMVDRITPATTDADRAEVRDRFGIDDQWPVVCEPFAQWVLQDTFADGRPPYERAGVQVVGDVTSYELNWPVTSASRPPTPERWPRCTCTGPEQRSNRWTARGRSRTHVLEPA
jgi:Mannitol dehydrogenase Rossmann domain